MTPNTPSFQGRSRRFHRLAGTVNVGILTTCFLALTSSTTGGVHFAAAAAAAAASSSDLEMTHHRTHDDATDASDASTSTGNRHHRLRRQLQEEEAQAHYVECGAYNKCPDEVGRLEPDSARHEIRCCTDVDPASADWTFAGRWDVRAPRTAKTPGMTCPWTESPQWDVNCPVGTYPEAVDTCAQVPGGRLCTLKEVVNDCVRGTGCGHDRDLIWTSTTEAEVLPAAEPEWTTLLLNDFEDGGWQDLIPGGADVQLNTLMWYTAGPSRGSVRLIDNNQMASSVILPLHPDLLQQMDDYQTIRVRFWTYVRSFENSEHYLVEYCSDGGTIDTATGTEVPCRDTGGWTELRRFTHGQDFVNDASGYHTVEGIPKGGTDPHLRFRIHASGRGDYLYLDHIEVQGTGEVAEPGTDAPTSKPSVQPSVEPSVEPSVGPSSSPSASPTASPEAGPSASPSSIPTSMPSASPSETPTAGPSATDDCASNPCSNGGTCVELPGAGLYNCTCPLGYTGEICEVDVNDCASNPCKNGATCTDGVNSYSCECAVGWTGDNCDEDSIDCISGICNTGSCQEGLNSYTCDCAGTGFSGTHCEVQDSDSPSARPSSMPSAQPSESNDCIPDPCEHGGVCMDLENDYLCDCTAGWGGKNCSIDTDDCYPEPCMNGGQCTDLLNGYECTCPPGYSGSKCENYIGGCNSSPCKNSGECQEEFGVGNYSCICNEFWTGQNCTVDVNECTAVEPVCHANAACLNLAGSYTCTCPRGYRGDGTAVGSGCTEIDECDESIHDCDVNADCVNTDGSYTCSCHAGYSGNGIDVTVQDGTGCTDVDECQQGSHSCDPNASCTNTDGAHDCACDSGFSGNGILETVEGGTGCNNIDDCPGNLCENGSTCVDGINNYTCTCASGYAGTWCEVNINDCVDENGEPRCQNNGTCTDGVDEFSCDCEGTGYIGDRCHEERNECTDGSHNCHANATCANTPGQYTCTCKPGFTGNGVLCVEETDAPSPRPTTNPTRHPTGAPSSSPSSSNPPTSSTVSMNCGNIHPDSPTDVNLAQGGTLEVTLSTTDSLCTLTEVQTDSSSGDDTQVIPIARSYNGREWESAAGGKAASIFASPGSLICSDVTSKCTMALPAPGDNSRFVLTSYGRSVSQRNEVARFLDQNTFGVTTDNLNVLDVADWTSNPALHRANYIKDQMDTTKTAMTSHREYWRARTNPKVTHSSQVGRTDHPCDPDSRWRKYSCNRHDRRNMINGIYRTIYFYTPESEKDRPDPDIYEAEDLLMPLPGVDVPRLKDIGNNLVDTYGPGYYGLCEGDCDKDTDCAGPLECFQRNDVQSVPGCYGWGRRSTDFCYDPNATTVADPTNANPGYYIDETPSSGFTGWNYLKHDRDWKYGREQSWVEFTITVPSAGNYPLSFRYSQDVNWLQDIDLEVTVNSTAGGLQVQIFNTGYSFGSNDWRYTPYYYYDLDAGENKVRVQNTNYYGAKIDHLRVGKAKATIINVDGHNRTVVHDRVYYTEGYETNRKGDGIEYSDFNNKVPYEFCDFPITPIEQLVEGRIRVRKVGETYCGSEATLSILNPMVDWSGLEDQVPGVLFTGLPNLDDQAWTSSVNDEQDIYKALNGFDFQLTTGIDDPTMCMEVPTSAEEGNKPVFAKLSDGTYLQWTPQLILDENTPENPIPDGGGEVEIFTDNGRCSNVPRNFLNEHGCILSAELDACQAGETAPDIPILLDETNIKKLFNITGRYVYAILGLILEEHQAICSSSVTSDDFTRWMKNSTNCTTPTPFSQGTADAISSMLSGASDTDNPLLVDVRKPSSMVCDYDWPANTQDPEPIQIQVGDTCYTQVHPHLYNVYDATGWVEPHPGGAWRIKKWAEDLDNHAGWHLIFPRNHPGVLTGDVRLHPMSRWDNHGVAPKWTSLKQGSFVRFLDYVSFRDLDNSVKLPAVAQNYDASPDFSTAGATLVCGSPGEVANDPVNGALYDMENPEEDTTYDDYMHQQKTKVWTMIALNSPDQLRQRMAWALSQIVTVVEGNIDAYDLTEIYLNYYDIMVRNAFGNYRDVLKESSFSPLMAEHLTYLASKSHGYVYEDDNGRIISPDENFAREIMQLFTIGLLALDDDGTPKRVESGTLIETYTNDDIMSFARAWTGFQRRDPRGNYEDDNTGGSRNRLDPLYIDERWRDRFPKSDLTGGYIGDTYPLCVDVPDKMFLRPGAKYRLLGADPLPELMVDHPDIRYGNLYNIKRMVLDPTGDLFAALNDGSGTFSPLIELSSHLSCTSGTAECVVDTVRVVQVQSNPDVFYEYVPPPCVHQAFYEGGKQIARRYRDWEGVMCADPRLAAASEACCDQSIEKSVENAFRVFEYHGERMKYASAEQRCLAKGASLPVIPLEDIGDSLDTIHGPGWYQRCQGDCDSDSDCAGDLVCFQRYRGEPVPGCSDNPTVGASTDFCYDMSSIDDGGLCLYGKVSGEDHELGYHWNTADCSVEVKINNEGYVAIVHDTFTMQNRFTPAHINADETLNWFKAYWDGDSYPSPATGCGQCRQTTHVSGVEACVCDATVIDEAEYIADPSSVEDIVSTLNIGAVDPAAADAGSYNTVAKTGFTVHFKGAGSTTYDADTIFELDHPYHGTHLFLKNMQSTVQLKGWTRPAQIFEAEDAVPGVGTNKVPTYRSFENDTRTDYTGTGFVDFDDASYAYLNFTITATVPSEETVKISFRYENSWGPSTDWSTHFALSVNGNLVEGNIFFPTTGHWDFWAVTPSYTVTLQPGSNTIQLREMSGEWAGPKLDHMLVEGLSTSVDGNSYSFRNAPHFMGLSQDYSSDGEGETNPRDAYYETDAVIDHYFQHTNTAPFICTRLIQRHGISNPSPRYVKECATAFRAGTYQSEGVTFGSEKYGCLEATAAAISLDPEATSPVLDRDPTFGSIKEPWMRVIQLLKSLEVDMAPREKIVELWELSERIGEEPSRFQSVFSFFLPEYVPDAGPAIAAGMVSPESMLVNMPTTIDMMNGLWGLIRYGVSDCYDDGDTDALGFGRYPGHGNCVDNGSFERGSAFLSFVEKSSNSTDLVDELSTLLTQGRLSPENRDKIITAVDGYTPNPNSGDVVAAKRRFAMQLIVSSPEFHTSTTVQQSDKPRLEAASTGTSSGTDYKATILLFFDGGADTYNMLPPHTCNDQVWEKYEAIRGGPAGTPGSIALPKASLWELPTNNANHTCQSVGLHQNLHTIKDLYHAGDAIFVTNTGLMSAPVSKDDYRNQNVQLFAHNAMQLESKRLDLGQESMGTGVLGRMRDSLMANGIPADAYSVTGNQMSLIGKPGNPAPIVLSSDGMKKFDPRFDDVANWWGPTENEPDRNGDMTPRNMDEYVRSLNNATSIDSSMMAETWSIKVSEALDQHELLYDALSSTSTTAAFPDSGLGRQLRMVTQMMQTRQQRGVERDFFHVSIGGWDTHSWVLDSLASNFNTVDDAIAAFVEEVRDNLGLWDNTILVQLSEFARTLDPNTGPRGDGTGAGSDHAWGGHQFIIGGGLNGGKVFGQYPSDFTEEGPLALSRGRMLPTTPWDSFWSAAAPWMGVPEVDMDTVLPMRNNFDSSVLFNEADVFNP